MELNLTKPICFFDLETTGVNVGSDRIVEVSILKVKPDGEKEEYTKKVNPGIPIPLQSSEIHGIYDIDVAELPRFDVIGKEVAEFIGDADLGGYNSNKFDVPILMEEFLRNDIEFSMKGRRFIDVQNIFHKMEQRTLKAAYKFYCDKELEDAHSAEADNRATFEVFLSQLDRYDELKNDMDFLHEFSKMRRNLDLAGRIGLNDKDVPIFNFGKHRGKPVEVVLKKEPSYYAWMMQGDFPLYTKKVLTEIKESIDS